MATSNINTETSKELKHSTIWVLYSILKDLKVLYKNKSGVIIHNPKRLIGSIYAQYIKLCIVNNIEKADINQVKFLLDNAIIFNKMKDGGFNYYYTNEQVKMKELLDSNKKVFE